MKPRGLIIVEDPDGHQQPGGPTARVHALDYVANQPIAFHVLRTLESAGIEEVVVASSIECAGAVRDCLESGERHAQARLAYVEGPAPLDLAAAVKVAAPLVGDAPCVMHVASGLIGEPLAPFVELLADDSPDVVLMVHQGSAHDEHLSAATQEMLHIAELDPEHPALAIAGVWLFGSGGLSEVSELPWRVGGEADLTRIAERITIRGGNVHVRLVDGWSRYAGDPLDLLEVNRIALDRLERDLRRPVNNGNRIEGRVQIHESASVRASVIVGPTAIGPGAQVVDAYIGPYTSIGPGARIEGVEIERSIVSAGARIMHVGSRMVASVVGRDAHIFRDFSLPRALRLRVGDGTEVAL